MSGRYLMLALSVVLALGTPAVQGREDLPGSVTSQGTAIIERLPEALRVEINLLAKGRDYQEALANLKTRRAQAREWLASLGASENLLVFADPMIIPARPEIEPPHGLPVEGLAPIPVPVQPSDGKAHRRVPAVMATLRADLPLKVADADELLLLVDDLQRKIKSADLGGVKALADDAQALAIPSCNACGSAPGDPAFVFVIRITEAERARLLDAAFANARANAAQLAQAAKRELGMLRSLTNAPPDGPGGLDAAAPLSGLLARDPSPASSFPGGPAEATSTPRTARNAEEAISFQPGRVRYRVSVSTTFALSPSTAENSSPDGLRRRPN